MRMILVQAGILFLVFSAGPAPAEVVVQVMSVQDAATAEKEAARLFSQGVPSLSRTEESADGLIRHRVYVGPFETEADATAAAAALKKNGTIKEFLLKNIQPEDVPLPAVPVLSEEESIAGLPTAPAKLPVAETPTYGEPVRPEQARSLSQAGLTGVAQPGAAGTGVAGTGTAQPGTAGTGVAGTDAAPVGDLPTYGQMEVARPAAPAVGQPSGLKPGDDLPGLAPSAESVLPPPPSRPVSENGPAPSAGDGSQPASKLASFGFLVDLSSSMRHQSRCRGLVKEEAMIQLIRKINRRIPGYPYQATMRVFGYKPALTRADFTSLYYGPDRYSREGFEGAISRLAAADAVTPLSDGLRGAEADLEVLPSPKTVLMFSDFQESGVSGDPLQDIESARRRHGQALTLHTFYITSQMEAERLAKSLARAGGGQAWETCSLLTNDQAFERMMLTVFGRNDLCLNAPPGALADERGCWVAAYSQFFDFNKSEVKSEFRPQLAEAARLIREHVDQGNRVVIAGFTDNVGSQEYNIELGRQRAQAVADILASEGVPAGQLSVVSYGKERPVADNGTDEGRARNRRVEFHVAEEPPEPF